MEQKKNSYKSIDLKFPCFERDKGKPGESVRTHSHIQLFTIPPRMFPNVQTEKKTIPILWFVL